MHTLFAIDGLSCSHTMSDGAYTIAATHSYRRSGTYQVTVTVTIADGIPVRTALTVHRHTLYRPSAGQAATEGRQETCDPTTERACVAVGAEDLPDSAKH